MFNIERFKEAQDYCNSYETALQEIRNGRKHTHWIWYIFPQIEGLGHSEMSQKYSIESLLEAKEYLEHPILANRLREVSELLRDVHYYKGYSMTDIFGSLDAKKVLSCMTLFDYVAHDDVFQDVMHECYDDGFCALTREKLRPKLSWIEYSAFENYGLKVDEKAFFESGSEESKRYSFNQVLGTFIELFEKGERMQQMVQHYLWIKDLSGYRLSGVESTLNLLITSFLSKLLKSAKDRDDSEAISVYIERLKNVNDVLRAAYEFDAQFYEFTRSSAWRWLVDEYMEESLLRNPDSSEQCNKGVRL